MNCKFLVCVCAAVSMLGAVPSHAADILDRIVATVNGHIILQSDWQDAVRYEALADQRPLDQIPAEDRKAALDHLIDQELLREQMHASDFPHATDGQIAQRIQEIRKQYAEPGNDQGWHAVLSRCELTESELQRLVARQFEVTTLVDARLRPNVTIDSKSIESYYNQELLPQLRQSGAKDVPLAEVTPRIKELLTQQKVNELLVAWL
jgi:peptidyl-prolyl cis-trans isomerase SurA